MSNNLVVHDDTPESETTSRHQRDADKAIIYVRACNLREELDLLISHVKGIIDGIEVDVAQLQPVQPKMKEIEKKIDIILEQQVETLKALRELSSNIKIVSSTVADHGKEFELIRSQHIRNHPTCLSSVKPPVDTKKEAL